ncbi:hypothetical protein FHT76_003608 [Rhizobium sp. BK176]|nr:hypothetical protein [Rhizobium sp. BK399]MCS3740108.1 hypothetical protein [Rhizobium sp. BK661]MCS4091942.1 hypothetical protein [Rhizobium sp. BK176]
MDIIGRRHDQSCDVVRDLAAYRRELPCRTGLGRHLALAVCGVSHKDGYVDLAMAAIASALVALVAVITIGNLFGSF